MLVGRATPVWGQPRKGRRFGRSGQVLEAHPTVVPDRLKRLEDPVEGEGPGARLAAPRDVGDLDVAQAPAVTFDRGHDVVAGPGHVVDVEQDADPASARRCQPVCEVGGIVDPSEPVRRVLGRVERLHHDHRADRRSRVSGERQVLQGEAVLKATSELRRTVAVEGVEPSTTERLGDLDGDGDVVAEATCCSRQGQQPSLAGGEVPAVEVEAGEGQSRIANGPDEGSDIPLWRDRRRERPPTLDRVEPGGGSSSRSDS